MRGFFDEPVFNIFALDFEFAFALACAFDPHKLLRNFSAKRKNIFDRASVLATQFFELGHALFEERDPRGIRLHRVGAALEVAREIAQFEVKRSESFNKFCQTRVELFKPLPKFQRQCDRVDRATAVGRVAVPLQRINKLGSICL